MLASRTPVLALVVNRADLGAPCLRAAAEAAGPGPYTSPVPDRA